MPAIDDLTINISLQTAPLAVQGFGLPLVMGHRAADSPLVGDYNEFAELSAMITAGFATGDPEYQMLSKMFGQSPRPATVAVYIRDSADTITEGLAEALAANGDWYALLITERDAASLHAAGEFALGNEKLFIGCCTDPAALTGRNNIREAYLIHTDAANFPEAAWAGMCLPKTIGSITWKWKNPTGVIASNFTLTQLSAIRSAHGQTAAKRSGIIYIDEGITTGGEFIDVIQARDFVKARLGEALFGLQIRSGKVPFDNSGLSMIESTMREVFKNCGKQGIIARAISEADKKKSDEGEFMYQVTVPERSEIPENDRARRVVTGITFKLTIAGAVHGGEIEGTITI